LIVLATHRLRIFALLLAAWIGTLGASGPNVAPIPGPKPATGAASTTAGRPSFVPGEVLLRFRPDASPGQINAVLRGLGATHGKRFHRSRVEHHKIRGTVEDAVAKFRNDPAIEFIEPDYIVHADAADAPGSAEAVPNDPLFPLQWSLRNTGQQSGIVGADIDAVGAWDQSTGSSQVIVAIIDSGMDWRHPDLAANVFTNPGEIPDNEIDDDGNGFIDDVHGFDFYNFDGDPSDENGHGTHVAGIIGAVGNNGIGIAGVAWRVQLLSAKFLGPDGAGATSSAIAAIEYAVDMGATILNNSWGGGPPSEALRAAIAAADEAGALFVAAAGNDASNNDDYPHFPSSFHVPNIISVASTGRTDARSEFSNYGPVSVDLAAPGTQIMSTLPAGETGILSGTSMAAPHVSGALALLKSRYPTMTAGAMKTVVLASTDRIPALDGVVASGGRLNVLRMLAGPDSIPPGSIGTLALQSASSDQIVLRWTATGDDGGIGTATRYDLRIATFPIDATNFGTATRVSPAPLPKTAGSAEQATIRALVPLTTYYAAVKAVDEYGNPGPISNVIEARTTAPPVASVSPASFDATRLTGLTDTQSLFISNIGDGSLDFTVQIAGSGTGPAWLGVTPRSGSALAGAASELTVTLNATGLAGGDYTARLVISTNDPLHRQIEVPATLHVVSAPDIDVFPTAVTFGPVVVGTTKFQTLAITNVGFADLHVTDVSVDDPRYTVDPGGFDLGPNGYWEVGVSVTPAATGPATGTITLHCDDPDESALRVSAVANGIVAGVLSIDPLRIDSALKTGAIATRPMTLTNAGGSALSWGVRVRAVGAVAAESADLSDVRVLFDASHGGAGPGAWASLIGTLTGRGAQLTVNSLPVAPSTLDAADVFWISEGTKEWTPEERDAVSQWVVRGGRLLLDGDDPRALAAFNGLLDATGAPILFETATGATGATTLLFPHEITRGASSAHIPGTGARLHVDDPAAIVIEDAAGAPAMASAFVGRGRILAATGRLLADFAAIYADNQKISTQAFEWLGGAGWLSVTPAFGTTQPGKSSALTARIDGSRLLGGKYHAELLLTANDPANPQTVIPVELSLTAAPDIAAGPATIHFGPVFLGATHTETLRLENVGVAPLTIQSIEPSVPTISVVPEPLTLAPGDHHDVPLTYAPTEIAPISGTVVVRSDDPDSPVTTVAFDGEGRAAPDISLTPGSFTASLRSGAQVTRTLAVANTTGSDLEYRVRFVERSAAAATPAGESTPAAPRPSWAEYRARAQAGTGRVLGQAPAGASTSAPSADAAASTAPVSADAATLPLVILDAADDGGVLDVLAFYASGRDGALVGEITMVDDFAPLNFGGFLSLDLDQNAATGRPPSFAGPKQELGAEYEIGFFSVSFGYVDLFDAKTGGYLQSFPVTVTPRSVLFSIPLSALGGDDGRMDVTGVLGNAYGATDWFPDRMHATIGGAWLTPPRPSGTVAAGVSVDVPLVVDARGLPEGAYAGDVLVESNDPDESFLTIPASLTVGGAAVLVVDTHPLLFGSPFLGSSSSAGIEVGNSGTTLLTVSSVASDNPEFHPDVASFTLEPGATRSIGVVFTPTAPGFQEGGLRITSDGEVEAAEAVVPMTGDCIAPPELAAHPDSLALSVEGHGAASGSITIENPGASTLRVAVGAQAGGPTALERGGPDAFGYRWIDSDQPGGPTFDWIDIRTIGTPIHMSNLDENIGPLPIGFAFPYYGQTFTTFQACTHGWISFTDPSIQFGNRPVPDPLAPRNLIAVFWDDLNFAQAERAYYYSDGERLIVEYDRVLHRVAGGPYTFELILDRTGAIVYQYLEMGAPVNSATIGIQNARGDDGITVVWNDAYLKNKLAVRFMPSPPWLTADPLDGLVPPGNSLDVAITADARDLAPGKYRAALRISSNDPKREAALLPVVFRVGPLPAIALAPASLEFGTVVAGKTQTRAVRVRNAGTAPLNVGSITAARPEFTIAPSPGPFAVAPGESLEVSVAFAPATAGSYDTTLRIESDDPDGARELPLHATATPEAPAILEALADLSPATIQRGSRGQSIRARIYLPPELDANDVDRASLRLQSVVPPAETVRIGDWNGDGRLDLEARFERAAVDRVLPDGDHVPVAIQGNAAGGSSFSARDTVKVQSRRFLASGLEVDATGTPMVHALHPNVPNPFNPETSIAFDVATDARVTLRIFTASGRLARTLVSIDGLPAGSYHTRWNGRDDAGRDLGSGVYFARLTVGGGAPFTATRRLLLVR